MFNKLISSVIGSLLVIVMSSCSNGDSTPETSTTPSGTSAQTSVAPEPVESEPTLNPDEQFINELHTTVPESAKGNEADYIRLAGEFCGFLDDGYTPQGIINSWVANGGDAGPASTLLKIAVPIYCPKHTKVVEVNLP